MTRHLLAGVQFGMLPPRGGVSPPGQAGGEDREWNLGLDAMEANVAVTRCIPADMSRRNTSDIGATPTEKTKH